jgi:hypothetical protein
MVAVQGKNFIPSIEAGFPFENEEEALIRNALFSERSVERLKDYCRTHRNRDRAVTLPAACAKGQ